MKGSLEGTVILGTGGFFDVVTAEGTLRCRLRGRLKKERKKTDLCVIGDQVLVHPGDEGQGTIEEVLPRRTRFSREQPGRGGARFKEDVLVANLDQIVVVLTFSTPVFRPRMLDRFLVIAEHNDVDAIIVGNKVDEESGEEARAVFETYRELGYRVLFTDALSGEGVPELRGLLDAHISAFAGPSGGGKSSLINAVSPGLDLRVGGTSSAHGKGRHTTRVATLHPLASGGYVADTPGIRELGTFDIPPEALDRCFREFESFLGGCTYRSCRHVTEPGCAVREAVDRGEIRPERYDSYLRMFDDEERPERSG